MLKKILSALLFFLPLTVCAGQFTARLLYSVTNVTTSAYVQLVASAPYTCNRVVIFDSSGQTLFLGIGSSGSEIAKIIIPPGGIDVPISINAGDRLALKALSGTANAGEVDLNCTF